MIVFSGDSCNVLPVCYIALPKRISAERNDRAICFQSYDVERPGSKRSNVCPTEKVAILYDVQSRSYTGAVSVQTYTSLPASGNGDNVTPGMGVTLLLVI